MQLNPKLLLFPRKRLLLKSPLKLLPSNRKLLLLSLKRLVAPLTLEPKLVLTAIIQRRSPSPLSLLQRSLLSLKALKSPKTLLPSNLTRLLKRRRSPRRKRILVN
jgi:hypothetical protein